MQNTHFKDVFDIGLKKYNCKARKNLQILFWDQSCYWWSFVKNPFKILTVGPTWGKHQEIHLTLYSESPLASSQHENIQTFLLFVKFFILCIVVQNKQKWGFNAFCVRLDVDSITLLGLEDNDVVVLDVLTCVLDTYLLEDNLKSAETELSFEIGTFSPQKSQILPKRLGEFISKTSNLIIHFDQTRYRHFRHEKHVLCWWQGRRLS